MRGAQPKTTGAGRVCRACAAVCNAGAATCASCGSGKAYQQLLLANAAATSLVTFKPATTVGGGIHGDGGHGGGHGGGGQGGGGHGGGGYGGSGGGADGSLAPAPATERMLALPAPPTPFVAGAVAAGVGPAEETTGALVGHCEALLNHGNGDVLALAVVEGVGLVSGGKWTTNTWTYGANKALNRVDEKALGLAALSDGRFAAACGITNTIKLWDRTLQRPLVLKGHGDSVNCVAALSGGLLMSGSDDKTVRIWNAATGAHVATLEGHTDCVHALAALPGGRLASGSGDKTIRLWNVATRACAKVLQHPARVAALAALVGNRLVSGCKDTRVYVWSFDSGVQETVLLGHNGPVCSFAVFTNGHLASGSEDNSVRVWDVTARACLAVLGEPLGGAVRALAVLPDGRLATGCQVDSLFFTDSIIRVWTVTTLGSPKGKASAARRCIEVGRATGCGSDCRNSHEDDGKCLRCGNPWSSHIEHSCRGGDSRGSWVTVPATGDEYS